LNLAVLMEELKQKNISIGVVNGELMPARRQDRDP
jgi:hypothetical protein